MSQGSTNLLTVLGVAYTSAVIMLVTFHMVYGITNGMTNVFEGRDVLSSPLASFVSFPIGLYYVDRTVKRYFSSK